MVDQSFAAAYDGKSALEKVQDALVDLIISRLPENAYCSAFPDTLSGFDGANAKHLVLVQYTGSRYGEGSDGQRGTQPRQAQFAIHLQLTSSGAPVRSLKELDRLRQAVQGQRLQGGRVQILNDALVDHDETIGSWKYIIEVAIATPAIAQTKNHIAPAMMSGN